MFNIYTFEQKVHNVDMKRVASAKENQWKIENKRNREGMADRYKQRVQNFIKEMSKSPIRQHDYYQVNQDELKEKKKIIGEEVLRFAAYKTEKERIKKAVEANEKFCESPPSQNKPLELRKREAEKEIGPQFRYTAKCTVERVYDGINSRGVNCIESNEISTKGFNRNLNRATSQKVNKKRMDESHYSTKTQTTQQSFYSMNPKLSPRNLLPTFHNKTHFQAATSVYLQNIGSLSNGKSSSDKPPLHAGMSHSFNGLSDKKLKNAPIANIEPYSSIDTDNSEQAKDILRSCNIIREKHFNAVAVHAGDSKLSSQSFSKSPNMKKY